MNKKAVLIIDAGHLRTQARLDGHFLTPTFVKNFAKRCIAQEEELLKVLYYDCPPYKGVHKGPISGQDVDVNHQDNQLSQIEQLDFFAVRRGTNKFRGWKRKGDHKRQASSASSDKDFEPNITQKGVDIRIALDIATIANKKYADRIILVSNDSDLIPAMKYARVSGLQVVLIKLPGSVNQTPMLPHTDIRRFLDNWVDTSKTRKR